MNNNNELIKQYSGKYPAFGSYMECMSRAFMTGLASLSLSFGGSYFAQHLLSKSLPYSPKVSILISSLIGITFSYHITAVRTKACQDAWMASEDKHTFLNPISERNQPSITEKSPTND